MASDQDLLVDTELVADPDAEKEMGPGGGEAIADEEIRGSRLLLVRRAAEAVDLEGRMGGAVELVCTFQPAADTRFVWARLQLRITSPPDLRIFDIGPRDVRDEQPVKFVIDRKGKLSLEYQGLGGTVQTGTRQEFKVYHCAVQGSGEGTSSARWDFRESPVRRDGLGSEQALALTLPGTGRVEGHVGVNARLARAGIAGRLESIRDMVMGQRPEERWYRVSFEIPAGLPEDRWFPRPG